MSIILLEPSDPRQSTQSTTSFVPMQNTEIGHPDRQFSVRSIPRSEDESVGRAVHGFESECLLFDIEFEHVFGVVLPVTRSFPEFRVEHVGSDDFLVVAATVLRLRDESRSASR